MHTCFILLLMFCSGCTYQQTVRVKYPIWGEERFLDVDETGSTRHIQILSPAQPDSARACLLIVHGMNEYIGRYGDIARHFSDRFIVAGMDLTAHGLSNPVLLEAHKHIETGASAYDASRAYLEQAQLRNLQPMRNDLEQALVYLIERCDRHSANPLPVFILSHSLGSLVSASYLLQTKNEALKSRIKGIIFSGPAFSVTEVPGWRGWFQNPFIAFTFHTHEHFLNPHDEPVPLLLLNQLLALITVPLQDGMIELVSLPGLRNLFSPTNPDWVEKYLSDSEEERTRQRNDNYIIRRSVLRYVLGVEQEIIRFRKNMAGFSTPYLLIYSEHDPITPAWGNNDFAAATLNNHEHNDLMLLTGKSHHEQLFSTPALRGQILHKIDEWINRRIGNRL